MVWDSRIAKKLVENYKGKAWLESEEGNLQKSRSDSLYNRRIVLITCFISFKTVCLNAKMGMYRLKRF